MDGCGRTRFGCGQYHRIPRCEDEKQGDLSSSDVCPPRVFCNKKTRGIFLRNKCKRTKNEFIANNKPFLLESSGFNGRHIYWSVMLWRILKKEGNIN